MTDSPSSINPKLNISQVFLKSVWINGMLGNETGFERWQDYRDNSLPPYIKERSHLVDNTLIRIVDKALATGSYAALYMNAHANHIKSDDLNDSAAQDVTRTIAMGISNLLVNDALIADHRKKIAQAITERLLSIYPELNSLGSESDQKYIPEIDATVPQLYFTVMSDLVTDTNEAIQAVRAEGVPSVQDVYGNHHP